MAEVKSYVQGCRSKLFFSGTDFANKKGVKVLEDKALSTLVSHKGMVFQVGFMANKVEINKLHLENSFIYSRSYCKCSSLFSFSICLSLVMTVTIAGDCKNACCTTPMGNIAKGTLPTSESSLDDVKDTFANIWVVSN